LKKIVLTFGLISGAISAALMAVTTSLISRVGYDKAELIGYTGIVLSALVVFFGIRAWRETVGAGRIGFGRGLAVGLLITTISALCYVAAFQLLYFKLMPGWGDQFVASMIEKEEKAGATPERMGKVREQAAMIKRLLDQPLTNAAVSFIEPFPIGVVVSLVAAGVLRRGRGAAPSFGIGGPAGPAIGGGAPCDAPDRK